jgi:hypothetical protein
MQIGSEPLPQDGVDVKQRLNGDCHLGEMLWDEQ